MTEVNLYRLHPIQRKIEAEAKRFNVGAIGRRFGKSLMGENLVSETAIDGYPAGWFSPTYKLMLENWRDVTEILKPIIIRSNVTERRIELITGGVVEFWSVDTPDTARGRKYKRVVVDEAAMIRYLKEAWENAIRPTLTDLSGDAWFFSTPKGRNYFWELYQRGIDPDSKQWKSWQYPTSANPYIPQEEIDQARLDLPELAFQQEYLAEFLENEGAVFRNVRGTLQPGRPQEHGGHTVVFGVDWGKQNDFTVIVGSCRDCKQMLFMDRFNQIDYRFQRERLKQHAHRWKPTTILPERNSIGEPNIEELHYSGLPIGSGPDHKLGFQTTSITKPPLIEDLVLAIEMGELELLDDPILIGELLAYERTVSASGRPKYEAPEGLHDDCVMALALAWNACATSGINLG